MMYMHTIPFVKNLYACIVTIIYYTYNTYVIIKYIHTHSHNTIQYMN